MKGFSITGLIGILKKVPALVGVFLLGMIGGCILAYFGLEAAQGHSGGIRGEVQKELPSPNGRVTAILTKSVGHWTTSNIYYDVYVRVEKNGEIEHVFSATNSDPAQIRWQNPDALVVHMDCGDIELYKNSYWYDLNYGIEPMFIGLEGGKICKYSNRDTPGI